MFASVPCVHSRYFVLSARDLTVPMDLNPSARSLQFLLKSRGFCSKVDEFVVKNVRFMAAEQGDFKIDQIMIIAPKAHLKTGLYKRGNVGKSRVLRRYPVLHLPVSYYRYKL